MNRTKASRGGTNRGLAPPPESEPGTLIVYSAKDGEVAEDGEDDTSSPFAKALVELKVPGREVRRFSTMSAMTLWRRPTIASSRSHMARSQGGGISISWRSSRIEGTCLAFDTCLMAKKPEPPKPTSWNVYKLANKAVWLGRVEALDETEAIEKAAAAFKVPANRPMAIWR
jgi:hypothetical protein